jgi:hypothetical protein
VSASVVVSEDGRMLTVRVPLAHRKRGGRKLVVAPDSDGWAPARPRVDNALVKALARAHRWRRMLESDAFSTLEELAAAERINPSYLSRSLRLTLLAPDIVEAIIDGRQPGGLQLRQLSKPLSLEWPTQRAVLRLIT